MAKNNGRGTDKPQQEEMVPADTLPEEAHPGFVAGRLSDADQPGYPSTEDPEALTPVPDSPLPDPRPQPQPQPFPRPQPLPYPRPQPFPYPRPQPSFCAAVSGRYIVRQPRVSYPSRPSLPLQPTPIRPAEERNFRPSLTSITVRVDVDRFTPQNRISIEVNRLVPRSTAHAIAEVSSDVCSTFNRRTVTAAITYRDGNAALIPGNTVKFIARRTSGFGYGEYKLELSGGGIIPKTYTLDFKSHYFDAVEFEVDRVSNSGTIVTAYNTGSHPNRPADLPTETLSLATIYQRAGFDVSMSPNTSVIPTSGAGSNGTWSDTEMHNAMVTYWSRFADKPQWAMWVLYAARHDQGRSLGGVMFDDIGPHHRQGTAIFTDSFIQDVPSGDPDPAAWRNRMQFWTAVHEMGHAFNLAHSWQKALGTPQAPGDPWIPLSNEPEARSFMNYPYFVSGGESTFFSDFRFRFSDDELVFMRHAPRRFVQMGNSDWFVNHGFEAPEALMAPSRWKLEIRPNRESSSYRHLEPITMEAKLINAGSQAVEIDPDLLADGRHITVFIQRHGTEKTRQWRAMVTRCHAPHTESLAPGASIYGAHMISTSTGGWLIDEPGFYKAQAAIDIGGEIVLSNVLRLYVAPPQSSAESEIALDYFTEDVGRVLSLGGVPELEKANAVLERLINTCADNPAVIHADTAISSPMLRDFKILETDGTRTGLAIRTRPSKVTEAAKTQTETLLKSPEQAADTMAHIPYFGQLRRLAHCMVDGGDAKGAKDVLKRTIDAMKARKVLASVIKETEAERKAIE
jgi:hypothetical protein